MFPTHYVLPVTGGDPLATFQLPPSATNIRWAPDGTGVSYVDRARGWNIMRKSIPDGEAEQITQFGEGRILSHRWHPDGSRLSVHRRVGRNSSLWEIKDGSDPTLLTEFKTGAVRGHWWAPDEPILYFRYGTSSQDVVLITDFR
jgi:Tol biopolymer transport system component